MKKKGKVTTDDIAKYRKVRISNESASQTSFYSLDERTYLGEDVQDCAVVVPYFLSVPTILQETDFTATLPMQTALRMQQTIKSPLIVVIPAEVPLDNTKGREFFYTQLIWHERVARDPAMQWFRGLFAAYATA